MAKYGVYESNNPLTVIKYIVFLSIDIIKQK